MAQKKKKKATTSSKNEERRIIDCAFDETIAMAKRCSDQKRAAKIYDLVGPILKRRKSAVLHMLPDFRERYKTQYPELRLEEIFADECSALCHTVDGLEKLYHFTLATALWMLDMLRQRGKLWEAERYLRFDAEINELMALPDFREASFSRELIVAMVDLISNRDERDNPYQWYINDASAKREKKADYDREALKRQDPETLTGGERFCLIMDMIPPECQKRAVERFEQAFWRFQDALIKQCNIYFMECAAHEKRSGTILRECEALRFEIDKVSKPFESMQEQRTKAGLFAPQNVELLRPKFEDSSYWTEEQGLVEELKTQAIRGLETDALADEAEQRAINLLRIGPGIPMGYMFLDDEELRAEDLEGLLSVEIEDPYEICFGYLCLMDRGSDIPWLYQPANAVLLMAARKFPWTAFSGDSQMLEWMDDGDEECEDKADEGESCDQEVQEPLTMPREIVDWTAQKAELYRLRYSEEVLYDPEEFPGAPYDINLPQLIYGMIGFIMPRNLHTSYEMHQVFEKYGMETNAAKVLELYLQLALECQQPCLITETKQEEPRLDVEQDGEEVLRRCLEHAKNRIRELEEALYHAEKKAELEAEQTQTLEARAAEERRELADLRELVYIQANEHSERMLANEDQAVAFPYEAKRKIAVFGGHETWLKAIRPMLPTVTFAPREQSPNPNLIRSQDVIWIQANSMAHKDFYKLINIIRTNQIPVHYFGFASAKKCALQLVAEDQKD